MNIDTLLSALAPLKEQYNTHRADERFNVFTALFKKHEEVKLHSRFIAYLLSPDSGHGKQGLFCELFVKKVLGLDSTQFDLSTYEVLPSEFIKKEFENIDILIINKKTRQSIIIENKIHAKDSNRTGGAVKNDGYDGQLERYYKTIKDGKNKDGKDLAEYQCDTIYIYYLTMYENNQPSQESIGSLTNEQFDTSKNVLYYANQIRRWLEFCLDEEKDTELSIMIQHYLNLINNMTNNDISIEDRLALKGAVAKHLDTTLYLLDNFKHVKWHTFHEFLVALKEGVEEEYSNVSLYPQENFIDEIVKVTHNPGKYKGTIGVSFTIEPDKKAYIAAEGNLSWGIFTPSKQWSGFKNDELQTINFVDFNSRNTYNLIDSTKMQEAVKLILEEIAEAKANGYKNLD